MIKNEDKMLELIRKQKELSYERLADGTLRIFNPILYKSYEEEIFKESIKLSLKSRKDQLETSQEELKVIGNVFLSKTSYNKCECGKIIKLYKVKRFKEASDIGMSGKHYLGICKCGNIFKAEDDLLDDNFQRVLIERNE